MIRTIKFRGKNKKAGKWIYGYYFKNRGIDFIAPDEFANGKTWEDYEVDSDSVMQFTGRQLLPWSADRCLRCRLSISNVS